MLGAIAASFAGVVAERFRTGESWITGRSRCDACGTALRARDLVPIVSWLLHAGRCGACGVRISARHACIEILLGLIFLGAYEKLGLVLALVPLLAAFVAILVIVLYDLRHMIIPPALSAAFIAFSLLYALFFYDAQTLGWTALEAIGVALFLLLFYAVSGGRAMGLGDPPVAFGLALLAGTDAVGGLTFSFWIGAAIGIIILLRRPHGTRMGIEVPFAPFLAAGFLLAFFTQWNPFSF